MSNTVSKAIRRKLETFGESGMDYWMVSVRLRDGRRFANVFISGNWQLGFPDLCPFDAGEIVDVEWEGHRRTQSGAPVPIEGDDRRSGLSAMTVNERLFVAGLMQEFDAAARERRRDRLIELLVRVELSREQAEWTVDALLRNPARYGY